MARTVRATEDLEDSALTSYTKRAGDAVRAGETVAWFELDGRKLSLAADTDGVFLRALIKPGLHVGEGAPIAILGDVGETLGWDDNTVRTVRLSILRKCSECGNDYPLNGLAERVRCTQCGDGQRQPPGFWRDYLLEDITQAKTPGEGAGGNTIAGKFGACTRQAFGIPPLCRKCYTLLAWSALSGAWKDIQQGPSTIACAACGEPHVIRLPPPWAHDLFPDLFMLLGETTISSSEKLELQPVVFKCPSCMAALKIDGAKRIVHCAFCDSDLYLPDDLWLHFNPASKRARWWMLFRANQTR